MLLGTIFSCGCDATTRGQQDIEELKETSLLKSFLLIILSPPNYHQGH